MGSAYKNYLTEIVLKLSGRLNFAGDTNIDHDVVNNLNDIEPMLYEVINILVDNARNKNRTEYSIQDVGKTSYDILYEIKSMINTID